jgi:hypothetical protein
MAALGVHNDEKWKLGPMLRIWGIALCGLTGVVVWRESALIGLPPLSSNRFGAEGVGGALGRLAGIVGGISVLVWFGWNSHFKSRPGLIILLSGLVFFLFTLARFLRLLFTELTFVGGLKRLF